MQNNAKKEAAKFLTEYNLKSITTENLKEILKMQGYTVIEFNNIFNDKDVSALINALDLKETVEHARGFTYVDQYRRIVFLNEDLSDDEKLIVLAHEEGHIYCNHFTSTPIIGKDVAEEHEANEFSHYILAPTFFQKCMGTVKRNKKTFVLSLIICLTVVSGMLIIGSIQKDSSYYGEYYLTATGKKYHKAECVFVKGKTNVRRMTVEEFESGDYDPCSICLP